MLLLQGLALASLLACASGAAVQKTITDDDLTSLSEDLLTKDNGTTARYVTINYQGRTRSNSLKDEAPQPLISVRQEVFQLPTVAAVRAMYDNYIPSSEINEVITPGERAEESKLLDAFLNTRVLTTAMDFLANKGHVRKDKRSYKEFLNNIWFTPYSRGGGKVGSSAFEHIFLAELKRGEISGMHNWLFFNNEEALRHADYLGYIRKLELGGKGAVLKLHYRWSNVTKPVGSMFVGTSPELEMALYTVCFVARPDARCPLKMASKTLSIKAFTFRYRGKNTIGSAYPEI